MRPLVSPRFSASSFARSATNSGSSSRNDPRCASNPHTRAHRVWRSISSRTSNTRRATRGDVSTDFFTSKQEDVDPSSVDHNRRTLAICTHVTRRRLTRPSRTARDSRALRTLGSARLVSRVRDRRSAHARTPHDSTAHSFFRPPLAASAILRRRVRARDQRPRGHVPTRSPCSPHALSKPSVRSAAFVSTMRSAIANELCARRVNVALLAVPSMNSAPACCARWWLSQSARPQYTRTLVNRNQLEGDLLMRFSGTCACNGANVRISDSHQRRPCPREYEWLPMAVATGHAHVGTSRRGMGAAVRTRRLG